MTPQRLLRTASIGAVSLLSVVLASCSSARPATTGQIAVDPAFQEFWTDHGGMETIGPPLSPARDEDGDLHQTFLTVEMIRPHDPAQPVHLAALGKAMGLAEPPVPPIAGQEASYDEDTGHTVYPGFASFYEALGGKDVAGGPIGEVVFRNGQVLQYFENLGLYRSENASPEDTRLIALGLTYHPPSDSFGLETQTAGPPGQIHQRPFADFLDRFGGQAVFGQPLTEPYRAEDGALEQVYERAVVFSPDGSARKAALRPLGSDQGPPAEPADRVRDPGTIYFRQTGHNVRWAFAEFYQSHDGRKWLGYPLAEATLQGDSMTQRFENAILTYNYHLPSDVAVQLEVVGPSYAASHPIPPTQAVDLTTAPATETSTRAEVLDLQATLGRPVLLPGEQQTITIQVRPPKGHDRSGIHLELRLTTVGSEVVLALPATDKNGRSSYAWVDEGAAAGEIVNVVVTASDGVSFGQALLQYGYGYPR